MADSECIADISIGLLSLGAGLTNTYRQEREGRGRERSMEEGERERGMEEGGGKEISQTARQQLSIITSHTNQTFLL